MEYHCYADDTQIYLSIDPEQADVDTALQRIETCIDDIRTWMNQNVLKLNDSKTEFMVLGSEAQIEKVDIEHIRVGDSYIVLATSVRNWRSGTDTFSKIRSVIFCVTKFSYKNCLLESHLPIIMLVL